MHTRQISIPLLAFSIFGASILSLSAMDFFEVQTRLLPLVFILCFSACATLVIATGIEFPKLPKLEHFLAISLGLALSAPRIGYLIEPILGRALNAACWDDRWHIQEMSSLIHSENYPPRSTFSSENYLSFYFAPWIFGAAMYASSILITAKQAIFLCYIIYSIFFSYFALYATRIVFQREDAYRKALLALVLLFGGFDIFYGLAASIWNLGAKGFFSIPHAEWWAEKFGFHVQYSNFFTLSLWVPHHFLGATTSLFATYILAKGKNAWSALASGILFSFALFSSVFACIGAAPILLVIIIKNEVNLKKLLFSTITFVIISSPITWMYLGRNSNSNSNGFQIFGALHNFWLQHKAISFACFVAILTAEFLPIALAMFFKRKATTSHKSLLLISIGYLASTFFISYSGANNYATRGSIAPIAALFYVATPYLYDFVSTSKFRRLFVCLFIPFFLGGIWEYCSFTLGAYTSALQPIPLAKEVLASNMQRGISPSQILVDRVQQVDYGWYILENFKQKDKVGLLDPDKEIMNRDNQYRITSRSLSGLMF